MSMMKKQQVEDLIKSKIIKMLMLNIQLNDILNQKNIFGIIKTLNKEIGGFQKIYGISLFYFFLLLWIFFKTIFYMEYLLTEIKIFSQLDIIFNIEKFVIKVQFLFYYANN
jgi:hypothetical protein